MLVVLQTTLPGRTFPHDNDHHHHDTDGNDDDDDGDNENKIIHCIRLGISTAVFERRHVLGGFQYLDNIISLYIITVCLDFFLLI